MMDIDDSEAPWHRDIPVPVAFRKKVFVNISKEMMLETANYESRVDSDGFGYSVQTDDADFEEEFRQQHRSIPNLLEILAKHAEKRIEELKQELSRKDYYPAPFAKIGELTEWETILRDCKGWKVEEIEVDDV